jgi:hypothetical protein
VPAWNGVSTWSTPMIFSPDHSGAHIAARIWWMRIDSPPASRWSDCAS